MRTGGDHDGKLGTTVLETNVRERLAELEQGLHELRGYL
jgi:hypothetical protein